MELTFRTMVVLFYKLLFLSQILKCGYCFMPTRSSAILESDFTMEDIIRTGLSDLTSEYFGAEDGESREEAISGIVQACNMVGYTQRENPIWSFSDEKISEGHDLLVSIRDRIVQQLSQLTPDYSAARETLGQIYYPLLKFYSNTNWVELGDKGIYKSLGIPGRHMIPVAPSNIDMCIACG
ncbi:von Willebrand factor A domain-containing protein 7-like [Ruditapes philippinarum]|uniref:von Willebrand factor A domain-containing protein 7-like n=1 Tax=Ruditapes philippinarum TaxID=129788 RepID=UPI00295B06DB|nr:von Willebrand factor A domain-containing protein 7-like [Ruditapes philippinarum]